MSRPVSQHEEHALKLFTALFLFSLPLIIYWTLPRSIYPLDRVLFDSPAQLAKGLYILYPATIVAMSFITALSLGYLIYKGSKVAILGETLILLAAIAAVFYYAW